jgi:hypothetical protein
MMSAVLQEGVFSTELIAGAEDGTGRLTFSDVLDLALVAEALSESPAVGARRVYVHDKGM